jgi:hypothetical protein
VGKGGPSWRREHSSGFRAHYHAYTELSLSRDPAAGSLARATYPGVSMFRVRFLLLLPLLFATAAGCHSVSVDSTHDDSVDFSQLHTYDWMSLPATLPTAAKDETVVGALATLLEKKGLKRSKENPDLLVAVHRTIEGQLNTKGSGYEFRDGRLRTYQLQSGSLVIDLISAKTKEAVWRSSASGAFRADQLPEERRAFLVGLMEDMFDGFPPRR